MSRLRQGSVLYLALDDTPARIVLSLEMLETPQAAAG